MKEKGEKIAVALMVAAVVWLLAIVLVAPHGNHTGNVAVIGFLSLWFGGVGVAYLSHGL